ncbi:hypothetical protein [Pandoraea pnomenusa]|uniref:hypothetical protein n=1 Tax=Pandoraea pnomenusa TaxID=93220 RepID=UPI001146D764|nr:hypothetical protein [Pandoraea pnomenusa]QDH58337.1 hypothetical protein FKQ53_02870 [Pandoraea pnomenusa]
MNAKKTPDQRFLDSQISLIMGASSAELEELLQAVDLDGDALASKGTAAIERARSAIDEARKTSDKLSALSIARQRDIAERLGVRRSVLAALAERRAIFETIPKRFLRLFASEVGATFEALSLTLSGPVRAVAVQHKSDQTPEIPRQVGFERLLRDASMTEAEIAELMREEN